RSISGSSRRGLSDVVLYGPITFLDEGSISILGNRFSAEHALLGDAIGKAAYVQGRQNDGLLVATSVMVFDDYAVPGSSAVLAAGRVEEVDSNVGIVRLSGLEVDVTSLNVSLQVGDRIAIVGTQPVMGGTILAESLVELDASLLISA